MSGVVLQMELAAQAQLETRPLVLEIELDGQPFGFSQTGTALLESGRYVAHTVAEPGEHSVRTRFLDTDTEQRSGWSNEVRIDAPPRLVNEPPALLMDAAALVTLAFLRWAKRPARGGASGGAARHGERSRSPKHLSGGRLRQVFAREKGQQ